MNPLKAAVVGLTLISGATQSRADFVTDWNKTAIEVMKAVNVAGNPWTRTLAMMHVSMSDAVNAAQNRYARFTPEIPSDPNASAEAAAAAAAREILMRQYPGQKARIDEAFAATMDAVPDNPARAAGIALGEKVAATRLRRPAERRDQCPRHLSSDDAPGVWVPTTPPLFPQYATAKPWGMQSASQFRPGPPPELSSALYARDYNETKEFGGVKSTKRTDAQSDAVRFWTQANLGPAWFQAATQVSARRGLSARRERPPVRVAVDGSRQLLHRRLGREVPVQFLAADHGDPQWRPGRQRGDRARRGLAAAQRNANASGISVASRHQCRRGERHPRIVFGKGPESSSRPTSPTPACRANSPASDRWTEEHKEVRIWGGIHFRNSLDVGEAMGQKIADHLVANFLKPTR